MQPIECTVEQLPYWAKTYSIADLIASPRDARAIRVNVQLNGKTVAAQIDSGASVSTPLHGDGGGDPDYTPPRRRAKRADSAAAHRKLRPRKWRASPSATRPFRTPACWWRRWTSSAPWSGWDRAFPKPRRPRPTCCWASTSCGRLTSSSTTSPARSVFTYNGGPIFEAAAAPSDRRTSDRRTPAKWAPSDSGTSSARYPDHHRQKLSR